MSVEIKASNLWVESQVRRNGPHRWSANVGWGLWSGDQ